MVDTDIYGELAFPLEGVNIVRSFEKQRPGTTAGSLNVRAFDNLTGRARGSSRSGIVRYLPYQPIGSYPIQDLNYLITDAAVPTTSTTTTTGPVTANVQGQFTYALAAGAGDGLGAFQTALGQTAGVSIGTYDPITSPNNFAFACSCWDSFGNAYLAQVNTTAGTVFIRKVSATGVASWGVFPSFTVTTGSLRRLAGMVVIGSTLFVAYTSGGASKIAQMSITTGATITATWYNPGVTTWSTTSQNCLGAVGNTIGWESAFSTGPAFVMCSALNATATGLVICPHSGTQNNSVSSVCSDGTGFFYTIASVTTNQIRKIAVNATGPVWSNSLPGSATPQCLCYSPTSASGVPMLVAAATGGTYGVQWLELTAGSVKLGNSSLGTTWNAVDTDGLGNFVLYKNSAASNDIIGVNSTFSTVWGPNSFANTTHYGASVNKVTVTLTGTGTTTTTVTTPGQAQRQVTMLGVSNGTIFKFDNNLAYLIGGGSSALNNAAPYVFSTQLGTKMFWADGQNYVVLDALTGLVTPWTLTAGTFPRDKAGNGCRLIETWNGRLCLSGLPLDSQNWFMSAVSNPLDFNIGVFPATATMAVFGNDSPLGLLGAPVMCMIPYVDNTMIFGLSHQIWLLQGDPQNGGSFVLVTDKIGMPFGRPWCKDPNGQVYFMSSRQGIFKITPGALPVPVSQNISPLFDNLNLSANIIRLEWDTQARGFGVWITPIAGGPTTNYFYEDRVSAWWPDAYGAPGMNPNCVKAMDGDSPNQRTMFLGCQDGFIRSVNPTATMDDYLPIASFVYLGPIGTRDLDVVKLKALHTRLAAASSPVTFSVYVGNSAESAFNSQPVMKGTWTAGHNPTTYIRYSGTAVYIRIDCSGPWANEIIQMVYRKEGLVQRRQ